MLLAIIRGQIETDFARESSLAALSVAGPGWLERTWAADLKDTSRGCCGRGYGYLIIFGEANGETETTGRIEMGWIWVEKSKSNDDQQMKN